MAFPRVRGVVPPPAPARALKSPFSPRVRGCSGKARNHVEPWALFPAYAGLFLEKGPGTAKICPFPRVCGVVPAWADRGPNARCFSPRVRGCSCVSDPGYGDGVLSPRVRGCSGDLWGMKSTYIRIPRTRGVVPTLELQRYLGCSLSPLLRGCSWGCAPHPTRTGLFPACAGLFPVAGTIGPVRYLFPAYAGLFLDYQAVSPMATAFPRTRGVVPMVGEPFPWVVLP